MRSPTALFENHKEVSIIDKILLRYSFLVLSIIIIVVIRTIQAQNNLANKKYFKN